jgi:phosphoglycolate phosphatase
VLLQRGFEAAGLELAPSRLEELYRRFLVHYGDNICVETRLFPGAEAALDRLEDDGFALAICTNKIEAHSVALLRALGVAHRFAAICGRDTFAYFKPDPRHLSLTVDRCGGDSRRAVMVGDSRSDIAAAKGAGIPVVAVTFGYTEVPVQDLRPDAVIDHFDNCSARSRICWSPKPPEAGAQWAWCEPPCAAPMPRTANSASIGPARSKWSVARKRSPSRSGRFSPMNIRWYPPGFSAARLFASTAIALTGRIRATEPSTTDSWISDRAAISVEAPVRRSGVDPAFWISR